MTPAMLRTARSFSFLLQIKMFKKNPSALSPCQDIPVQVFMVRLVPTADLQMLFLAPEVQLAEPTEQAPGKSVDPSKGGGKKKRHSNQQIIGESSTSRR